MKYQLKTFELEENVLFCLGFCECCGSEGVDHIAFSRLLVILRWVPSMASSKCSSAGCAHSDVRLIKEDLTM